MKIIEYFSADNRQYWLEQIKKSDWCAATLLHRLLAEGRAKELLGETTKVLLLTEGEALVSFCTLSEQDEVREPSMTPWIGFVFTFPQYRGRRLAGELLEHAYQLAKRGGAEQIYISTDKTGVYEKYGYEFYKLMHDLNGGETRVYQRKITD